MADETPPPARPDLVDPSAHGLDQDQDLQRDEDEMLVHAIRKFGPLILVLVLVLLAFFGWGAYRNQNQKEARIEGTQRLQEALTGLHQNPSGTRKAMEDLLAEGIYNEQPLKPWVEFFIVKSHVIEAQQKLTEDGTPPEHALAKVDKFLGANARHKELTAMALLAKASLLEDLGRYNEAKEALSQASINPDAVGSLFASELNRSAEERQKLWEKFRNRQNP